MKQAWIEKATRVGLIEGLQDTVGLQRLKGFLGATYTSLGPGCDCQALMEAGIRAIQMSKAA